MTTRWIITTIAVGLITILSPGVTWASTELETKIGLVAPRILKAVENQSVEFKSFRPNKGDVAGLKLERFNSGAGIEASLRQALLTQAPKIFEGEPKYELSGKYEFETSSENDQFLELRIHIFLNLKGNRETAGEFSILLTEVASLDKLFPTTGQIPPVFQPKPRESEDRQKTDQASLKRQQVYVDSLVHPVSFVKKLGNPVFFSSNSQEFGIEILVANHQLEASSLDGMPLVDIPRGQTYQVSLHNNSNREIAVSLQIDGVDGFHFSQDRDPENQARPRFSHWIVPARSHTIIPGWHHQLEGKKNFLAFLVTEYGKGAVSGTPFAANGSVGVIHAQFSDCSPLPEGAKPKSPANETGFGPSIEKEHRAVCYEVHPPTHFVSVRYSR